jgi:tetratricopeptide (TPR) repeat protein
MKKIALAALLLAGWTNSVWAAGYDALNIGIQYANDEAWDNAIVWLNKAIDAGDLLPDQVRAARYNRARAYVGSGKPGAAIADFNAALALTPDNVQILTERAFAYIADGQGNQAIADLQKAHEKRPKNARIDYFAGLVNWSTGHPEEASANFAAALKENNSPFAWLWLKLSDVKQKKDTPIYGSFYSWPNAAVDLYSGREDEAGVLSKVKNYGDSENCEAIFFIAEWRLVHDDAAGAKAMFQKSISDCPKENIEPEIAQLELVKLP